MVLLTHLRAACLAGGVALLFSFAGVAEAGISYSGQSASAETSGVADVGQALATDSDTTSGTEVSPGHVLLLVSAQVGDAMTPGGAFSSGIHNTMPSRVIANSNLAIRSIGPDGARATGTFQTSFTIDEPYVATHTFQPRPGTPFVGSITGYLSAALTTDQGQTVFDEAGPLISANNFVEVKSEPFVLSPGTYNFTARSQLVAEGAGSLASGEYTVWMDLAPLADGPAAVPLPPAAWMGLVMLGGLAINQYRKSRQLA